MIFALVIVLISLAFGFVFARLDGIIKNCKILKNDIEQLQKEISEIKNNNK